MPRVIKQEPRRNRETPLSPCAGRTPARVNHTPTMISRASEEVNLNTTARRQVRSLAPSVDTRQAMAAMNDDSDSDPDLVVIREMRQVVKPDPDHAVPGRGLGINVDSNSLLNRNFERIAKNLKALGESLGELHSLGIQQVTDLPSLVLVGDQSSGKSTLMSGIAGISLPHREGMCTRCPVHIRLSKSDAWSLQISLQQDYSYDGSERLTADNFGPWSSQPRVVKEFWSCRDKDDDRIRNAIRWAQVAILNHNKSHRRYMPQAQPSDDEEMRLDEEENSAETDFSPNAVALQVSGPNLPDISFYDLPGLIKTTRREEDHYLVKVVENMARKYIADPNAIIMWAVPMNSDPENSSTLAIIRKEKAQHRTVGVLTKADLLPPGNHEQWLGMLNGTQHSVGHGFFITARQPKDAETQNSFEEAFFNGQAPDGVNVWSDRFQRYADRCGLNQLVVFLSNTLSRAFSNSLPGILETISDRLQYVNHELTKLPDTPEHPYAELREALIGFVTGVKHSLGLTGDFDSECKSLLDDFERKILELKPRYIVKTAPSSRSSRGPITPQGQRIGPAPTPSRTAISQSSIDLTLDDDTPVPTSRRRRHDAFLEGGQQSINTTAKRTRHTLVKQEESFVAGPPLSPVKNDLATVRRRCQARARDGEPDVTPPDIYPELSLEAISRWARPLDTCVDSFIELLSRKLYRVLEASFEKLRTKAAFREAKDHLASYVQLQKEELSQSLSTLFSRESKRLYTRNNEAFERHKQAEREILLHRRYECRWREHQESLGKDSLPNKDHDKLTAQEKKDKANNLLLLGPDEYARELEICAHVRGYYLTAAKRFIDCVGQAIVSDLIPNMVETLSKSHLDEKLGLMGPRALSPERIDALMAEEHHVAVQRKKLQDEQQKLHKAMDSITKLESAGSGEDDTENTGDASSEATNAATSFASRRGSGNGNGASQSGLRYQGFADDGMDVDLGASVA